jgi:hypothetical protein
MFPPNFPVARQHILNNATVGLQQWKRGVFYVVRVEMKVSYRVKS